MTQSNSPTGLVMRVQAVTTPLIKQEGKAMIYKNRYQAKKMAKPNEITVKVNGGYINMDAKNYKVWRAQK